MPDYAPQRCYYCHSPFRNDSRSDGYRTREHRQPKARGGSGGVNVVWACAGCNNEKGGMTEKEYRHFLDVVANIPRQWRVQRAITWRKHLALLAQRIEHEPSKLGVEGSIPSERTDKRTARE